MKPGDKVRFVHTKGEGVVRKIIDEKTVEVEIEDGFVLPFQNNEVVVIAAAEGLFVSGRHGHNISQTEQAGKPNGVYLAFTAFNDKIYSLHLINDTHHRVLYTFHEKTLDHPNGISAGEVAPGKSEKLKEYNIHEFETWPEFVFQLIKFSHKEANDLQPLVKSIKFKAASFYKSKQKAPVIHQQAFLYQLDQGGALVNKSELEHQLTSSKTFDKPKLEQPMAEIDLHMEVLMPNHGTMNKSDMLKYQFDVYEKQLENAIAANMEQITFIHGSGNGTLKNLIHKNLTSRRDIQFFQDAQKEKFGYGATLVKIR